MDWTQPIDSYCERLGPGYWAEPLNALTNLAFLLAAFIMWRRLRGRHLPLARAMVAVLALIGVGSWLFHTHAQPWAGLADVVPIAGFVLLYFYAANRDFWRLGPWSALGVTALFFPYAAAMAALFSQVPGLGASAGYAPVPLLILAYAVMLGRRSRDTARRLAVGAGILVVSLTFRTLDQPLCAAWPVGTHFLWHILNATMLGWMIETYRRHMLAAPRAQG